MFERKVLRLRSRSLQILEFECMPTTSDISDTSTLLSVSVFPEVGGVAGWFSWCVDDIELRRDLVSADL